LCDYEFYRSGLIDGDEDSRMSLKCLVALLYKEYWDLVRAPYSLNMKLPKVLCLHRTIDSFNDENIQRNLRFSSKERLRSIIACF